MQNEQKKIKRNPNLRICVTGGAGFIGLELIKSLNELGYKNILLVDNREALCERFSETDYDLYRDFVDYNDILEENYYGFIDNVDFCFHLGANSSTRASLKELFDTNLCFTAALFKRAKCPIVFASSAAVYDSNKKINPLNDYGITKLLGEKLAESHKNIICLRYHNVYGANESHKGEMASLVYKWISGKREKENLFLGSELIFRDFIHVDDVVSINIMFLDHWLRFKKFAILNKTNFYDVGSSKSVSFQQLAEEIIKYTKNKINYIRNPYNSKNYQFYTRAEMGKINRISYFTYYNKYIIPIKIKKGVKMVYDKLKKK